MKQVKKAIALAIGSLMSISILSGCSANGLALYGAFNKAQAVKATETKTDISINVSAQNLSSEEKQIEAYLPLINSSKFSVSAKSKTNDDKTSSQVEGNIDMLVGGMPINMGVWVDADFSQGKNNMKEIVKMPDLVSAQLPEFKGKQYMVMDLSQMMNTPGAATVDYSKLSELGKAFQPKITDFVNNYMKQYNPDVTVINKLDRKTIQVFGKDQAVDVYQLKLDDSSFKKLIKYTVNNFGDNKDTILSFLKDYLLTVDTMTKSMGQTSNIDVQSVIDNLSAKLPEIITQVNSGVDSLQDVKLLGDQGITIEYAVNDDGYIVNEQGTVQFVLDTAAIEKLAASEDSKDAGKMPNYTGVYTVTLSFNNDIRSLDSNESIVFPETNADNSINYMDLIKLSTTPKIDNVDEAYKNAYNSVMLVTKIAKDNNVKPSFFKYEGSLEVGNSDTDAVVNAASKGLQEYINSARNQINAMPDSLLNQKQTLSSILDNYENSIYERTVFLIKNNKNNPKQSEVIKARVLIKQVNPAYKTSYSTALDNIQGNIFKNVSDLVDKAVLTKNVDDINNAKNAIQDLKTIPDEFLSNDIINFINSLDAKLN